MRSGRRSAKPLYTPRTPLRQAPRTRRGGAFSPSEAWRRFRVYAGWPSSAGVCRPSEHVSVSAKVVRAERLLHSTLDRGRLVSSGGFVGEIGCQANNINNNRRLCVRLCGLSVCSEQVFTVRMGGVSMNKGDGGGREKQVMRRKQVMVTEAVWVVTVSRVQV